MSDMSSLWSPAHSSPGPSRMPAVHAAHASLHQSLVITLHAHPGECRWAAGRKPNPHTPLSCNHAAARALLYIFCGEKQGRLAFTRRGKGPLVGTARLSSGLPSHALLVDALRPFGCGQADLVTYTRATD